MKPIRTYKRFFRLLHQVRTSGEYSFVLLNSNWPIQSNFGRKVNAYSIWSPFPWNSTYTTHLSPFQVLFRTYFQRENERRWVCCEYAAKHMGLPDHKFQELRRSQLDIGGHLLPLRQRMLKACGLVDILNIDRPRYKHHGRSPLRTAKDPHSLPRKAKNGG